MKLNNKRLIVLLILLFLSLAAVLVSAWLNRPKVLTLFQKCVHDGGLVIETYPAKCEIDGQTYDDDRENYEAAETDP